MLLPVQAFDLDLDFPQGRLRLWPRGETELASWQKEAGLSPVPAAMVPGGVLGVRASGSAKKVKLSLALSVGALPIWLLNFFNFLAPAIGQSQ